MRAKLAVRIENLERERRERAPLQAAALTDDRLAAIVTGDPRAKAADLTDATLEAIAGGAVAERR